MLVFVTFGIRRVSALDSIYLERPVVLGCFILCQIGLDCFVGLGRIRPLLVGLIQFDLRCVGMSCSASFWVGLGGFEFV